MSTPPNPSPADNTAPSLSRRERNRRHRYWANRNPLHQQVMFGLTLLLMGPAAMLFNEVQKWLGISRHNNSLAILLFVFLGTFMLIYGLIGQRRFTTYLEDEGLNDPTLPSSRYEFYCACQFLFAFMTVFTLLWITCKGGGSLHGFMMGLLATGFGAFTYLRLRIPSPPDPDATVEREEGA